MSRTQLLKIVLYSSSLLLYEINAYFLQDLPYVCTIHYGFSNIQPCYGVLIYLSDMVKTYAGSSPLSTKF